MKKIMLRLLIIFVSLFIISLVIFLYGRNDVWGTLSVVFGVTSYHFGMRLLVGAIVEKTLCNTVDYTKKWFSEMPFEKSLYAIVNVKKWKKYMPTYDMDCFDVKKRSIVDVMKASCQAEIVHEIIMVFSFLPIILIIWLQASMVFVFTSILAALFDSIFVIIQRFNRPRLVKLLEKR